MPHTLVIVLSILGRAVLFVAVAVVSVISLSLLQGMFFGVASMSLRGFDILPSIPSSIQDMQGLVLYVYLLIFGFASLGGIYVATIVVIYTYYKDEVWLERQIEHLGGLVIWMIETTFTAFILSFAVVLAFELVHVPSGSTEIKDIDFETTLHEAKWFLLAVLLYAGVRAANKVFKNTGS